VTTETVPKAADAAYLTEALRRSGVLVTGRVASAELVSSRRTVLSLITRLRLTYDGPAADAPQTIIVKSALPDQGGTLWNGGRQEVAFYTQVASVMSAPLVPRCFDARCDSGSKTWHLLLEDFTDSHIVATVWPLPPTFEQCESIVQARARFHAAWWDDPRLGSTVGSWLDSEGMTGLMQRFSEQFARFTDRVGDRLPRERRRLYERLVEAGPRLIERNHSHHNLTIVQGDAHVWNCFLPRDGEDVRLFDWDCWRIDVGSDDLAYMIAMHWYPDRRRRMERPLLDRYHAALVAHGVRGYDRRALDEDYRLSALWHIMTPVWQAQNNLPPVIWWNNLERILLAFDDLRCRDLLG
jgi:Ecdysteroid kinase-like family